MQRNMKVLKSSLDQSAEVASSKALKNAAENRKLLEELNATREEVNERVFATTHCRSYSPSSPFSKSPVIQS